MNDARPDYYRVHEKIGTLEAYMGAAIVVIASKADPGPIQVGKKLLEKAVAKCKQQGIVPQFPQRSTSAAAGPKAKPAVVICEATAAAYAQPILPAIPMQEAAVSVMSPAPRKLEFEPPPKWSPFDKAVVFTSAAPREAPPPVSIVDTTHRVLMSASARFVDGVRGMLSAKPELHKQAAAPDVGQKRLMQHDAYTDTPKKAQAVGGAAGGKAPAKQVLYAKMNGVWDEKVVAAMKVLESKKIYMFNWLYPEAEKELSTLPRDNAVQCLRIMRDFKTNGNICKANEELVSRAQLMRGLYYLKSADEIFQEQNPKDENGNDTEDDDADTPPKVQVKADVVSEPKVQVKKDAVTPPKVQVKEEECYVIDD